MCKKGYLPYVSCVAVALWCQSNAFAQIGPWSNLSPTGGPPVGRYSQAEVFDNNTGQMIIFGGRNSTGANLNDVWRLSTRSNYQWTNVTPAVAGPSARAGAVAAYDENNSRLTVFGGSAGNPTPACSNDTWTLVNANGAAGSPTWVQLHPSGGPPAPRVSASAVYDAASNRMILFGGSNCLPSNGGGVLYNDVWVLSNANGLGGTPTWTQLSPNGTAPGVRDEHSAVYDASTNRMMVFGGVGCPTALNCGQNTVWFNDVWVLTNANGVGGTPAWIKLTTAGPTIPTKTGHTAIYDRQRNRMVVFSGVNNKTAVSNDVWILTSANGLNRTPTWSQATISAPVPAARQEARAVVDSSSNRMIVFGGVTTSNDANDVWALGLGPIDRTPPFGSWDVPAEGASGSGAIAVGGWALDDIGVERVEIWREAVQGETGDSRGLVYIGNAFFVEGARPDVAAIYPSYPSSTAAGWGMQILTNMLPEATVGAGRGNGTYRLHAFAFDFAGNPLDYGARTIVINNRSANKPFGTIDTPGQGEVISGTTYVNFAWALTPQPNTIPTDGSTCWVFVDGQPLGHPVYNQYRPDVSSLFPGLNNSNGPVGYFILDLAKLGPGLHSIAWSVTDNAGHIEGIGSRLFQVAATSSAQVNTANVGKSARPANSAHREYRSSRTWHAGENGAAAAIAPKQRFGFDADAPWTAMKRDELGRYTVDVRQLDRLELRVGGGIDAVEFPARSGQLPVGSSMDGKSGVFAWVIDPAYRGGYTLKFRRASENISVVVRVLPQLPIPQLNALLSTHAVGQPGIAAR